jgi:hypothetical protein
MLLDRPAVEPVPLIRSFATTAAEVRLAAFWRSPAWNEHAGAWLALVGRVRVVDVDLADAIEDTCVEAIAEAVAFGRRPSA